MTTLKETMDFMCSNLYKERFVAEYWQTKIRYEKLKDFCNKIEAANISITVVKEPKHDCPLAMLREQQNAMGNYLRILELRAIIEHVDLGKEIKSNDYGELE